MLCASCSNLAFLQCNKKCNKCQGQVYNNVSVICEPCSSSEGICSVCLKKNKNSKTIPYKGLSCKTCGNS